jgi:Gamma-glutamyl cyclotransferase, AIG2-like
MSTKPSTVQRKVLGDSSESLDLNIPSFRRRYCFLYGTLMDPSTLAKVLGTNHRSLTRTATVTGYACKLWVQCPALVDGPPGETVLGVAYKIQNQDEKTKLERYEGDLLCLGKLFDKVWRCQSGVGIII